MQQFVNPSPEFMRKTDAYLDWRCNASCWPDFSGMLAEQYHVPVMIVPGARGSSFSAQWLPNNPAALYPNMLKQVRLAGGRLAAIIVNQGESDCLTKEIAFDKPLCLVNPVYTLEMLTDTDDPISMGALLNTSDEWLMTLGNILQQRQKDCRTTISADGKTLTIDPGRPLPAGAKIAVRYAWKADVHLANLRGTDDLHLPAYPFEMEITEE
jgi:hypothetical protein